MSKYIDLRDNCNKELLVAASNCIKEGKLVIFPTETVYGIGADGLNANAVKNIFIAKGRASDNPLILHVSSIDMINRIAYIESKLEKDLINAFFPGPLTIILKKKEIVPNIVCGNLDTVGVRMPINNIAHDLIELSNTPIAAPSANISGRPSGTNIKDIYDELNNRVDYIIDGGDTNIGLESTVIRVINDEIHILRPGKITYDDLSKYGKVVIDSHVLDKVKATDKVLSPGMKYRHYAPKTKCVLVYSENNKKLIEKMKELESENTLVITHNKNINLFKNAISYGETLEDISHNIFKILRSVDKYNNDLVIIEGVKSKGLGLAIMNRLIRACSHNYIKI
ncbi:MAG: threonylcarbamoyl-AMP synthase [Bacilli bacterium]|nr:threonylcarbamoyl-AMP synthase [Bacilli bacterium]